MPLTKRKMASRNNGQQASHVKLARARAAAEMLIDVAEDDEVLPDAPGANRTRDGPLTGACFVSLATARPASHCALVGLLS